MIAQVSIYDDGKFLNPRPIYIEPSDVESDEIETTYTFAFRYSVLKEEAIEALTDKGVVNPYLTLEALEIAIDALKERAERKTGRWIVWKDCEGKTRELTCSECGCQRRTWVNPNYCEDCGVKMEVDNG